MPEERVREGHNRRQEVSVMNWIGTLLLFVVPLVLAGVAGYLWRINLLVLVGAVLLVDIVLMVVQMLTTKRAAKRNAMVAALVLTVLFTVATLLSCAFFAPNIVAFVEKLNAPAAAALEDMPQTTPDLGLLEPDEPPAE